MLTERHKEIAGKIWEIANRLRGPYRPPQYRLVMLPMVVLRRLDCVLEPTKDAVLAEYARLQAARTPDTAIPRILTRVVNFDRKQPLYNVSAYTFQKLLGDSENIAPNLVAYINGFSDTARRIFERFKFGDQIEKLDSSNRLYAIVQAMAGIDLHPDRVSNIEMGYLFEHLVMRFNEQANEEAGDHFTPREVIRLMTHLVYTGEEDVYKPGVYREIYDPACGTGGMLSVSEETIRAGNASANLGLYGQEYNDESWAICCSDMLIKDEETDHIILGDTLGDGKTSDGFPGRQFHYMLANPPFGVEWKDQQKVIEKEAGELGFSGRFGAGLPAINDGSLLFLQRMISKMKEPPAKGGEGSKIAIIFNGSPLFSGDAGSGPSNIRRWIIENDWLDAIVAQQVSEGTIDLSQGEADPLKGPTDVGTGREKDTDIALSTLVEQLNERFGTDFTEADQLFFDQVRATAERDEKIVEAAKANTKANFSAFFGRILDDLFIQRMEGNDEIFHRVMSDKQFRAAAQDHLAREVYERLRGSRTPPELEQ